MCSGITSHETDKIKHSEVLKIRGSTLGFSRMPVRACGDRGGQLRRFGRVQGRLSLRRVSGGTPDAGVQRGKALLRVFPAGGLSRRGQGLGRKLQQRRACAGAGRNRVPDNSGRQGRQGSRALPGRRRNEPGRAYAEPGSRNGARRLHHPPGGVSVRTLQNRESEKGKNRCEASRKNRTEQDKKGNRETNKTGRWAKL